MEAEHIVRAMGMQRHVGGPGAHHVQCLGYIALAAATYALAVNGL